MTLLSAVAVFCGGGLGALMRFLLSWMWPAGPSMFPWTTLTINIAGSFLIAMVWAHYGASEWFQNWGRAFLAVGVLGGFTTFSTFSLEFYQLVESGRVATALAYAGLSASLCIAAVFLAFRVS